MMKFFLYIFLAIVSFTANFLLAGDVMRNEYVPARYVVLAQQIRADMAQLLSQRHHMKVIGMAGGLANRVNVLGLSFQVQGVLTKEQLRKILIDCVETFLAIINANEELRPSLKNFPFTSKEIKIEIYVNDRPGKDVFHPDIDVAVAKDGELRYYTTDKNDTFSYKSEQIEKYEDALKLVRGDSSGVQAKDTRTCTQPKEADRKIP